MQLVYPGAEKYKNVLGPLFFSIVWYDAAHAGATTHAFNELIKAATGPRSLGFKGVRFDGEWFNIVARRLDSAWNDGDPFQVNIDLCSSMRPVLWMPVIV